MGAGPWTADHSQRTAPFVQDYPGYVVSYDGDCQRFRDREVDHEEVPYRNFVPLTPDELEPGNLEELWYMGILVCPDEEVAPIADRVAEFPQELGRNRVGLYLAPNVDEIRVIREWKEAGLGPPQGVYPFDHDEDPWRTFHKRFGNHHAAQVDEDQRKRPDRIEKYRRKDLQLPYEEIGEG